MSTRTASIGMIVAVVFAAVAPCTAQGPRPQRVVVFNADQAKAREAEVLKIFNARANSPKPISHFNETHDSQQLLAVRQSASDKTLSLYGAGSDDGASWGVLSVEDGVAALDKAKFLVSNKGVRVGTATVSPLPITALKLREGVANRIYIYHDPDSDNAQWYALVDRNPKWRLNVTRYRYKKYDGDDKFIPNSARWDWERDPAAPTVPGNLVMGFPCARAWCLVGTVAQSVSDEDPIDPDKDGSKKVHHKQRVPGWGDRAIDAADFTKSVFIYPDKGLDKLTKVEHFDGSFKPVGQIVPQGAASSTDVAVQRFPATAAVPEHWQVAVAGVPGGVATPLTEVDLPPFAIRWTRELVQSKVHPLRAGPNSLAQMVGITTGGIWVRCANGCCSADVDF